MLFLPDLNTKGCEDRISNGVAAALAFLKGFATLSRELFLPNASRAY